MRFIAIVTLDWGRVLVDVIPGKQAQLRARNSQPRASLAPELDGYSHFLLVTQRWPNESTTQGLAILQLEGHVMQLYLYCARGPINFS